MSKADELLAKIEARKQQNALYDSGMSVQFNKEEERINSEGSKVVNTEYVIQPDFSELSHQYNIGNNPEYASCVIPDNVKLTEYEEELIEGMREAMYKDNYNQDKYSNAVLYESMDGVKAAENAMNQYRSNKNVEVSINSIIQERNDFNTTDYVKEDIGAEMDFDKERDKQLSHYTTSESECVLLHNRIKELIVKNTNAGNDHPILQEILLDDDAIEMGNLRDCPNFHKGTNKVILYGERIKPEGMYISVRNTCSKGTNTANYYFTVYTISLENNTNHILLLDNSEYNIFNNVFGSSGSDSLTIVIDSCVTDTNSAVVNVIC